MGHSFPYIMSSFWRYWWDSPHFDFSSICLGSLLTVWLSQTDSSQCRWQRQGEMDPAVKFSYQDAGSGQTNATRINRALTGLLASFPGGFLGQFQCQKVFLVLNTMSYGYGLAWCFRIDGFLLVKWLEYLLYIPELQRHLWWGPGRGLPPLLYPSSGTLSC